MSSRNFDGCPPSLAGVGEDKHLSQHLEKNLVGFAPPDRSADLRS